MDDNFHKSVELLDQSLGQMNINTCSVVTLKSINKFYQDLIKKKSHPHRTPLIIEKHGSQKGCFKITLINEQPKRTKFLKLISHIWHFDPY